MTLRPRISGLIEDRRGQLLPPLMPGTIPKKPYLSDLQKMVINPPWMTDDRSLIAAGAKEQPADIYWPYTQLIKAPAERAAMMVALSRAYRMAVQGMRRPPPQPRSGR